MDPWLAATVVHFAVSAVTFFPSLRAVMTTVDPKKVVASAEKAAKEFDRSPYFEDNEKQMLKQHFERLSGTLVFWKNQAAKYKYIHYYCLIWTIPSAVLIPILAQASSDNSWSKVLLTAVSGYTAILLAFHRGFKVEDNYKSFRHGESEFYDLYRRLLDRPQSLATTVPAQIDAYFSETETIRRFVRNAETSNLATLDEGKQMLREKKETSAGKRDA